MLAWMLACGGAPATIATTGPGVMGMTGGDADGTSETADAGSTDDSTTAAAPTTSTSDPGSSTGDGTSTGSTTGSTTGANDTSTTGPAPPPELVATPITDMNRAYVEMHGGWGHHLRGLMRAADDSLWFTVDAGEDVLHNRTIRYFRRGVGEGAWTLVTEQQHTDGVQQNAGSILLDGLILTYAVNTTQHTLEECYLVVGDPTQRACNAITISGAVYVTPPAANYVGAAVLGDGARIVWFTVVGENGGPGELIYTYNYGGGWNGPVVAGLGGANDIGYVHAMATAAGGLALVGQTFTGSYPNGTYAAVVADLTPGQLPTFLALAPPDLAAKVRSSADLFHDPASGATHVLASFDGAVAYYHRPGGAAWADHLQPLHVFPDTYRARFVRPEGGPLSLARGSASDQGTWLHHAVSGDLADAVAWADAKVVPVAAPAAGFLAPSAIYVESATYQRTPVGALGFALCGQYALADHQIFHVTSE